MTIKNNSGIFSSYSKDFHSYKDFKNKVLSTTAANDLMKNTIDISNAELKTGDIILMDTGIPGGMKDNIKSHTQIIESINNNILNIKQGNFNKGSGKFNSKRYGGEYITTRQLDISNDVFYGANNILVNNATENFGISFRRWNFYAW